MTERPILFSAPMVRAIIGGRKTQTRRVVKPQSPHGYSGDMLDGSVLYVVNEHGDVSDLTQIRCPYGQPGDLLWVRETWRLMCGDVRQPAFGHRCGRPCVEYRAACGTGMLGDMEKAGRRWKPSIFMPRWASRLTLRVTGVRVEKLQAISQADAVEEGVGGSSDEALYEYRRLWDEINGKRPGCAWADNPWVWVVSFERVTP